MKCAPPSRERERTHGPLQGCMTPSESEHLPKCREQVRVFDATFSERRNIQFFSLYYMYYIVYRHTHTHPYIYMCTPTNIIQIYIHTYRLLSHTHTRKHTQTHAHTRTHTHIHIYIYINNHIHIYIYINVYVHICTPRFCIILVWISHACPQRC